MLKKGSKLYSILTGTCPRCQSDHMFSNRNPYNLADNLKMHDRCRKCGLLYKMEPSFFFGAMYVSYAVAVALGILIFGICQLSGLGLVNSFGWIFGILIVLMPIVTRVSRNIYINFFINYDPKAGKG